MKDVRIKVSRRSLILSMMNPQDMLSFGRKSETES